MNKFKLMALLLSLHLLGSCSKSGTDKEASENPEGVEITDAEADGSGAQVAATDGEAPADGAQIADGSGAQPADASNLEEVKPATDSADKTSPNEFVAETPAGTATGSDSAASTPSAGGGESSGGTAAASVASSSSGPGDSEYVVNANETLMMIAFKLYGDYGKWKEIASLNQDKLNGGTMISKGMKLRYNGQGAGFNWNPEGKQHLVQKGDTLSLISKSYYGTIKKWKAIWENNKPLIKDPAKIFIGFTIFVPEKGMRDVASAPAGDAMASSQTPAKSGSGSAPKDQSVVTAPQAQAPAGAPAAGGGEAAKATSEDFPADI